jgi:uncharacterized protein
MRKRFFADVMLGRLARFMRFQGYDVEYSTTARDFDLLRKTKGRILLTKDRDLAAAMKPKRAYLIASVGAEKQLAEIYSYFPDDCGNSRCLVCNGPLRRLQKKNVQHLVPPFVFQKYTDFYRCSRCRRIYWKGSHFERMSHVIK